VEVGEGMARGRPKKEISKKEFEKLRDAGLSIINIAKCLGVGHPALKRWHEETYGISLKSKTKAGRPKIEIDKNEFEQLCAMQCTLIEISDWFHCSEDIIEKWSEQEYGMKFKDVFKQKRSKGKISLRRSQFRLAETNATMGIWLGKQYLDQRDVQEIEISKNTSMIVSEIENYVKGERNEP